MGVAGLWEVLRPAGQVRSLTELAVEDGFNTNPSHQRGFRIGIDASIWFFHAAYGREGENPELRTLFFRCCRLLQVPLLPLFVFDGPNRPAVKRGKRIGGNAHWLTQGMKNIIDAFGFEWRIAPGEAEAELAYLNRIGTIDAVLSDDVDNFLFGATMVIRNPSSTLSGNRAHPVKNAQGKDDGNHVITYTAGSILSNPSVALSRAGTILVGLLSGGDYIPAGLPGCGQKFATGLARAGFGDSLVRAVKELKGSRLDTFLEQWRQDIRNELKTNKSGLLPSKKPSLAASLPDDFPALPVLMSYADPLTSENAPQKGKRRASPLVWRNDPDPMRIASLCELYFEWGVKDVIVHRFRTVLWPGIVCRAVRRAVVDEEKCQRPSLAGVRHLASEENSDSARPSSPTKQLSSTFSSLTLSSAPKKSPDLGLSASDSSALGTFTLSSLVPLVSPASPSSSRTTSPCLQTSPGPRPSLLLEVLSQRTHASTNSTLEYRVLLDPTMLVERAASGVKGLRPPLVGGLFGVDPEDESEDGSTLEQDADESGSDGDPGGIERLETAADAASKPGTKKRRARQEVPTKPLRLWLPACMIRAAAPALAEAYEEKVKARLEKARRRTKGERGRRARTGANPTSSRTEVKGNADDDCDESVPGPSVPKRTAGLKEKSRAAKIGGRGRRKPKQASEAQDDAYEFIDLSAGESPCSSDEEGVKRDVESKGKAKAGPMKSGTKASTKIGMIYRKATTTDMMMEFFNTTKPPTTKTTKSKQSTSQPRATKASAPNNASVRRIYEEEEDSADAALAPPLPKSLRPLDLLRAKSKPGAAAPGLIFESKPKSTDIPRYEEEESSSSSSPIRPSGFKPSASNLPCLPRARKKPIFVDVSDTASDIEVSDVRRPSLETTTGDGKVDMSVGVGKTLSTFASDKNAGKAVGYVIGLAEKRIAPRSNSAPMASAPIAPSPICPVSAPLGTCTVAPTPTAGSPSKLAHILLPRPTLESEDEEASEGDELPTFHRGSTELKTMRSGTIVRPPPRPFPLQLATNPPVSPRTSKPMEGDGRNRDSNNYDVVEIVDVFTTPRGPSPLCSPTPSPLPVKPLPDCTSARPITSAKSRQPVEFPTSPNKFTLRTSTELQKKARGRDHALLGSETPVSENEKNGVLKSPRKSVTHSSPRHVSHVRGRASSPTPMPLTGSPANNVMLGVGEGYDASNDRPQPETSGPIETSVDVGWEPRMSDASAIYISSGSEDEGNARLSIDHSPSGGEVETNEDQDECTDQDADTRADTAMILSAPPSPVRLTCDDLSHAVPAVEVAIPNPVRRSKFKPASTVPSKVDVCAPSFELQASARIASAKGATNGGDTAVSRSVCRAPLLIARAKQSKDRDDDIIDLTSD